MVFTDGMSTARLYMAGSEPFFDYNMRLGIYRENDPFDGPTTLYPQSLNAEFGFFSLSWVRMTSDDVAIAFDGSVGQWYYEVEFVLLDDADQLIVLDPFAPDETMLIDAVTFNEYNATDVAVGVYVNGTWERLGGSDYSGYIDFPSFTLTSLAAPVTAAFWTAFNQTREVVE
jgi:hypothetical protein